MRHARQSKLGKRGKQAGLIAAHMAAHARGSGVKIAHDQADAGVQQPCGQIAHHQRGQRQKQAVAALLLRRPMV